MLPNWENLIEMNNFLDIYQLPKLFQDQISNLCRSIITREIKAVMKISSQNTKGLESDSFKAESFKDLCKKGL